MPESAAKGKVVAAQHRCASCHKDNFRGERAAAAIANQREDYLVKALTDYRSAARPSVGVAAMNEAAAGLRTTRLPPWPIMSRHLERRSK